MPSNSKIMITLFGNSISQGSQGNEQRLAGKFASICPASAFYAMYVAV